MNTVLANPKFDARSDAYDIQGVAERLDLEVS